MCLLERDLYLLYSVHAAIAVAMGATQLNLLHLPVGSVFSVARIPVLLHHNN